ncbi:hypothetical protein [Legionella sp. PC997]|uniref:hypothetical protein n=1 Tax=Legionella sp. PC997 TaxID=2755562 RepID=UPI0015F7DDA5|nr:hypothetical protein [Legionella sp. PC997]QMT59087.1 hypothetical protein HBNCFIEN_00448 [Legionella sp. PC997]
MTIRYLSFDFDGCLFNKEYCKLPHDDFSKHLGEGVLDTNKDFLDWLKRENAEFSAAYAFIGSTRQDYYTDLINGGTIFNFKGSCCPAMETICNHLAIHFDPLLLADLEGDLESGTSFKRIMDEIRNNSWMDTTNNIHKHASLDIHQIDECKRTILFAQMQKASIDHPGEEIIFDFFDDRLDILYALKNYFTQHPHMIPINVHLRLHAYAGKDVSLQAEIQGLGIPLSSYGACFKQMQENIKDLDSVANVLKELMLEMYPELQQLLTGKKQEVRKPVIQTKPKSEISEGQALYQNIIKSPYFVANAEEATTVLKNNKELPFVIRESRSQLPGMITFTLVSDTSKGIIFSRYALNHQGELFSVDDKGAYKIPFSGDLFGALKADIDRVKKRVDSVSKLEEITFTSTTAPTENKANLTKGLLAAEKGFFADSEKTKPTTAAVHNWNLQP